MAHNYNTKLHLHWRNSNKDIVDATSMAQDLLENVNVKAVIGPQTSAQAQFVAQLGEKARVPVLSFSATSPSISNTQTPYFIRTMPSDSTKVKALATIIKAFGWREVVLISEDTPYGNGIIPSLMDALQEINARVPHRCALSHVVSDYQIIKELYELETMQTRVFIVHLSSSLSSRLFFKACEIGMMSEGYAWIITDGLVSLLDSMNSSVIQSIQGVLGVRPHIPSSKKLDNFIKRWRRYFLTEKYLNRNQNFVGMDLNNFGLWAYDTVWALAKAVEQVGIESTYSMKPETRQNSTELAKLGVSDMGSRLRDAIWKTNFRGLTGKFNLTNGHLDTPAFEIVNMNEKGERVIGFWTPIQGLSKKLNPSKKTYSSSKDDLKPIIWPGESTSVPKGWVIPTTRNGNKMRIGVPKRHGFTEFVSVEEDPETNQKEVTGYSIDVFKKSLALLSYGIDYEFVPFEGKDRNQPGTYNELIDQIYLKNLDAGVGDVTIVANRSLYVDFTLPYTESGVTLLVLVNDNNKKKAWIFLEPLCWDVWITTGAAFIFTGMVVWALEHRINDEFRGEDQVGVTLWFTFSTLVFAHKERLVSNWSRLVVIIWVFVVWILTTSYTASFTSLLTLQQLQPAINDINDLIKNRDYVGYQGGGFTLALLKSLGVKESMIKAYATAEEYATALSKGTQKGGVGAIFDELPYLRLFLAQNGNCAKYKMVGPIYKTGGFGFVFPMGYPLVADLSRAILNVTQGSAMKSIETWIGPETICSDQASPGSSSKSLSLTLDIFWGLFLVTGIASISAFLIFFFSFLHKNRDVLITPADSTISFRQRLAAIIKRFHEKDLSHHTFRKNNPNEGLATGNGHSENSPLINASTAEEVGHPNPNRGTATVMIDIDGDAPHFQPSSSEPLARRGDGKCSIEPGGSDPAVPHLHELATVR